MEEILAEVYPSSPPRGEVSKEEEIFSKFIQCLETKQIHLATTLAKRFTKQKYERLIRKWRLKRQIKKGEKVHENDETLLHYIVNLRDTTELLYTILQICPDLAYQERTHPHYYGQTPLHIAISSGNKEASKTILKMAWLTSQKHLRRLFNVRATGTKFHNTVMMGELPLFVAALKNDYEMVKTLISYGAAPYIIKGSGDTIFHVLIQYAALYRDKVKDVRKMIAFLHDQLKKMMDRNKKSKEKKKILERKLKNLREKQNSGKVLIAVDKESHTAQTVRKPYGSGDALVGKERRKRERNDLRHVWFVRNNRQYTALELAAKHGLTEIFNDIFNLEDIYCHYGQQDGLFDDKAYDITEIDTVAKYNSQRGVDKNGSLLPEERFSIFKRYPKRESILQMMYSSEQSFTNVAALIDLPPIKLLIKYKWHFYRRAYMFWMLFHYVFVVCLSAFAVLRSHVVFSNPRNTQSNNSTTTTISPDGLGTSQEAFVSIFRWVAFGIAIAYLTLAVLQVVMKIRKPNAWEYVDNNFNYIFFLFIFSLGIIVDAIMHRIWYDHDGIPILLAVLAGWWFNAFFIRGWRLFGFFTVMINRVIFGDFFRFSVFIALQLFCFSTIMTVIYQGVDTPAIDGSEDVPGKDTTYQSSLFKMFQLMLGITSLPFLNETNQSWLAYTMYILFILTTYILLINALIAMMSATCAHLLTNRYSQWRVQQLSVMIFLEDLLSLFGYANLAAIAGGKDIITQEDVKMFNPSTGIVKTVRRYYLKMTSLVKDAVYEDIEEVAAALQKRDQLSAESAANKAILNNIQQGKIEELDEGADTVMDDGILWEMSSFNDSEPEEGPDPSRFYTIYHEFDSKTNSEFQNDEKSDNESTESKIRKITKTAALGKLISYPRKARGKVTSQET